MRAHVPACIEGHANRSIFTGYGPGDEKKGESSSPVAKFIRAAMASDHIVVYGDGLQKREFLFVDDIVEAPLAVAVARGAGRVYNLGTGVGTTVQDLIALIGKTLNRSAMRSERPPEGYVGSIVADIPARRSRKWFRSQCNLADGLRQALPSR